MIHFMMRSDQGVAITEAWIALQEFVSSLVTWLVPVFIRLWELPGRETLPDFD